MNKSIRIPDWRFFYPKTGDFVELLKLKPIYLFYNSDFVLFVLADRAGTAKKKHRP